MLRLARDLRRPPAVVLEHERDLGDVFPCLADGLPRIQRLEPGEAFLFPANDVRGVEEDPTAPAGGRPRPPRSLVEGPSRGGDRGIDVGRFGVGRRGDHGAGRGVEHVEALTVLRVDPLPVDEVLQRVGHRSPPVDLWERPDLAVVPLRLLFEEGAVLQIHLVLLGIVRVRVVGRSILEDRE